MECTLVIDERLLDDARKASGTSEIQALVEMGLRELIRRQRAEELVRSFGTFDLGMTDDDLHRLRRADLDRLDLGDR
jgi:hypothetical protein